MSILTTADRFRRELEALIAERLQSYTAQITAGVPNDYSEYARLVGRIDALREILDSLDDVAHRLNYNEGEGKR